MHTARAVRVIPAIINQHINNTNDIADKKRVAAYARVSTDNEEQLTSYDAQIDYYIKYIHKNPDWEFVAVYTDAGISATSTKKRDGFKKMIADALDGKIDMIITKSVSRFARNTVDTLSTVRKLKEKGVVVYFEKENIYTMDSKGELLITIMSSLAQEESRSISENVTWGQRKRFADGKVSLPYKRFLGYKKGENDLPQIVEKEAKVVRKIYKMYLEGKTTGHIARYLTSEKIPTPAGKTKWYYSTVMSILKNEKYKGDAILQKTFTTDFLTKKKKINEGEVPQYYVKNSHPEIVSPHVFDMVQHEIKKRKNQGQRSSENCFSSKIICGECGSFYGSKVWHSNSKYRKIIWQCNKKFKDKTGCKTPHLSEKKIKQDFVDIFNSMLDNPDEIIDNCQMIIDTLMDTATLDKEQINLENECQVIVELMQNCINENASSSHDQEEYRRKYSALVKRYENAKKELEKLTAKKLVQQSKNQQIQMFMVQIKKNKNLLAEFDEELWYAFVDSVRVYESGEIVFSFMDGTKISLNKCNNVS